MVFTLEVLEAQFGDALLLHYGKKSAPRLILIDGGPAGVWRKTLKPRLDQLRTARADDAALTIDLMMVSHIDGDHIGGILGLTRALRDAEELGVSAPYDILEVWHNAFEDVLDDDAAPAALASAAGRSAAASTEAVAANLSMDRPAQAVVASIDQGRRLRDDARALALTVNRGFKGLVRSSTRSVKKVARADGLQLLVIGPAQERLDALRTDWQALLRRRVNASSASWGALVADFVDRSVYNLSSLIVVAKVGRRTMLLTGDARGDHILSALQEAKLLKSGKAHFDVFKVPHHGSERNVTTEFFAAVTADHYVISADGTFGNPDVPMLRMLTDARGKDEYTIHLTNRVSKATSFFTRNRKGKRYVVNVREKGMPSFMIELADELPSKLRPAKL